MYQLNHCGICRLDRPGTTWERTSGELWTSRDEGKKWSCAARRLPEIYSVETELR